MTSFVEYVELMYDSYTDVIYRVSFEVEGNSLVHETLAIEVVREKDVVDQMIFQELDLDSVLIGYHLSELTKLEKLVSRKDAQGILSVLIEGLTSLLRKTIESII